MEPTIELPVQRPLPDPADEVDTINSQLDDRINEIPHEEIATLAYFFWETRQGAEGSPEEDWYRAEEELRGHR